MVISVVVQSKESNENNIFYFIYVGGMVAFVLAMLGFGYMRDDPENGDFYNFLSDVFRFIALTHLFFSLLIYTTVKAVKGGYFEPVNLIPWAVWGALWFYLVFR